MVPSRGGEEGAGDRGQTMCGATRTTATVAREPEMDGPSPGHHAPGDPVWTVIALTSPFPPFTYDDRVSRFAASATSVWHGHEALASILRVGVWRLIPPGWTPSVMWPRVDCRLAPLGQ